MSGNIGLFAGELHTYELSDADFYVVEETTTTNIAIRKLSASFWALLHSEYKPVCTCT